MSKLNIALFSLLIILLVWARTDSASVREVTLTPAATATITPAPTSTPTPTPTIPQPVYLSIPKIQVEASIEPVGTDENGKMQLPDEIDKVGWYGLGYKPGENGNAVIAGHLDSATGEGAIFYHLRELVTGDEMIVRDETGISRIFNVVAKETYEFDKVPIEQIFGSADKKRLNLITCTGWWNAGLRTYSQRMIIIAEMKEE